MSVISYRHTGGLRLFAMLICYTDLFLRFTSATCAPYCQSCDVNGAGLCDACLTGYGLNINNTCTACSAHCSSCSRKQGVTDATLTCDVCIQDNTAFYFLNFTTRMCQPCSDTNCIACYDYSLSYGDYCNSCQFGFYLNNTAVTATSKVNVCRRCASNCATCSGPTSAECYNCLDGYTFPSDSHLCISGASNCRTCYGPTRLQCRECSFGYGLILGTTNCLPCTVNFCIACPYGQNTCNQCQSGFALVYDGKYGTCSPSIGGAPTTTVGSNVPNLSITITNVGNESQQTTGLQPTTVDTTSRPNLSMFIAVIVLAVLLGLALLGYIVMIVVIVKQREELKRSQQILNTQPITHPHTHYTPDGSIPKVSPPQLIRDQKYQTLDFSPINSGIYDELSMQNISCELPNGRPTTS